MPNDPTRYLHRLPPKSGDGLFDPRLWTTESFESNKKIVSNHPDPEKNCIGMGLPTRHPLHPKPYLQLLIKVLRLTPLIIPLQNLTRILLLLQPVRRHSVIKILPPLLK